MTRSIPNKPIINNNVAGIVIIFQLASVVSLFFVQSIVEHSSFVSLASILTNRLVLNLKQAGNSTMQHEASSTLPSLAFATNSFVGNLGAPLRADDEGDEDVEPQELSNNEHELQERNPECQGVLTVEHA